MKFKGTIGADLSGSLGGIVASHNRGGTYFRFRSTPVNPRSARQVLVRTIIQQLSDAYANILTQAQRDAWDNWADQTPGFTGIGIAAYQYCNLPRVYADNVIPTGNFPRVDDPPESFDVGSHTPVLIATVHDNSEIGVAFDNTDAWANEDDAGMIFYASPAFNPSRTTYTGRMNQCLDHILGDPVTPPTSPASITSPFAYQVGQKVCVEIRALRADGRADHRQRIYQLVTAAP